MWRYLVITIAGHGKQVVRKLLFDCWCNPIWFKARQNQTEPNQTEQIRSNSIRSNSVQFNSIRSGVCLIISLKPLLLLADNGHILSTTFNLDSLSEAVSQSQITQRTISPPMTTELCLYVSFCFIMLDPAKRIVRIKPTNSIHWARPAYTLMMATFNEQVERLGLRPLNDNNVNVPLLSRRQLTISCHLQCIGQLDSRHSLIVARSWPDNHPVIIVVSYNNWLAS